MTEPVVRNRRTALEKAEDDRDLAAARLAKANARVTKAEAEVTRAKSSQAEAKAIHGAALAVYSSRAAAAGVGQVTVDEAVAEVEADQASTDPAVDHFDA